MKHYRKAPMLPQTITLENGKKYQKSITEANNIKEGSLTATNILPGAEGTISVVRCVKALHLPQRKMEIAWVSDSGHKIFEGIYSEDTPVAVYVLI